jgi:hypothetical protein
MLDFMALLYVTERVAVPVAVCDAVTLETVGGVVLAVKANARVVGLGSMTLPKVSFTLLITALYEPLVIAVARVRSTALHEVVLGLQTALVTALYVMPAEFWIV